VAATASHLILVTPAHLQMQKDVEPSSRNDVAAIRTIIATQFECMDWEPGRPADWSRFASLFFQNTTLIPAARPARRQTVEEFIERMKGLEEKGRLRTFRERMLGSTIHVFGNIAVAIAACEMTENEEAVTRDVSGFLFIRDDKEWLIAGQAWDLETSVKAIPADLASAPA
jgi:Domain of unknown function (DUF4440)